MFVPDMVLRDHLEPFWLSNITASVGKALAVAVEVGVFAILVSVLDTSEDVGEDVDKVVG